MKLRELSYTSYKIQRQFTIGSRGVVGETLDKERPYRVDHSEWLPAVAGELAKRWRNDYVQPHTVFALILCQITQFKEGQLSRLQMSHLKREEKIPTRASLCIVALSIPCTSWAYSTKRLHSSRRHPAASTI